MRKLLQKRKLVR